MIVTSLVIIVVLGLSKNSSIPRLVARASEIHDSISANPTTFPTPNPSLAALEAAITALATAETAFKTRAGTKEARDNARVALVALLHGIHAYVQGLASANPAQADVIAKAASMTLRKAPVTHKSDLAVKPKSEGVVHVAAKALKGAKAHEWQYSTDGGKTWSSAPSTTKSSTLIAGLQPGASVQVKHRMVTKSGVTDWSDPVSAIVT